MSLQLEVVAVCWDALDGSTFYQLLDNITVSYPLEISIRVLMAFWYASVGLRISIMFATHLKPSKYCHFTYLNIFQDYYSFNFYITIILIEFYFLLMIASRIYRLILNPPLYFSDNPTVDRSMCALRLRCTIIMAMALSELYAGGVRIYLWTLGELSDLQIEMFFKNVLFLSTAVSAYQFYWCTVYRDW